MTAPRAILALLAPLLVSSAASRLRPQVEIRTTPSSSKTPKEDEMRTRFLALALTFLGAQVLAAQTKLSGAGTCAKPDVAHTIAIGDRPNHAFTISQTKCRWTKPFAIAGLRSKGGTGVQADEVSDSTSRSEERRVGKECRSRWSPYH